MIYEGKEYREVTDGSAEIGDLLSTTKAIHKDGQFSHFDKLYYFSLDNEQYPLTERIMQNGSRIQAYSPKPFKRYRYVEDVEETSVEFKSGDRVKVVGCRGVRKERFNGYFGKFMYINDIGEYSVLLDVGAQLSFPPETLKLFEETPAPKEKNIPLTNPKKAHDLINQTSKITNQSDTVNSPSHYNQTKIEAIDIIEDVTAGYQSNVKYHIGNAIKYLIRAPFKNNTVEDLKKAAWYIQRAIEKLGVEDK